MGRLPHVAKQPHSVVRATVATLTCSGGYRCLGVFREELEPVLPAGCGFRLPNSSFDGRNMGVESADVAPCPALSRHWSVLRVPKLVYAHGHSCVDKC